MEETRKKDLRTAGRYHVLRVSMLEKIQLLPSTEYSCGDENEATNRRRSPFLESFLYFSGRNTGQHLNQAVFPVASQWLPSGLSVDWASTTISPSSKVALYNLQGMATNVQAWTKSSLLRAASPFASFLMEATSPRLQRQHLRLSSSFRTSPLIC